MQTIAVNSVPTSAPKNQNAGALAASGVISAKRGVLYQISYTNTNAAARWLHLYNTAAVPADTAVPLISVPVAAGAFINLDFGVHGRGFSTGICWATSTTAATKTVGAADALVDARYAND